MENWWGKEIRGRVGLLRKQSLTCYYVYEVISCSSRGVNVVAVDATNTLFWYQQDAAVAIQKLFHDLNDTNDGKGSVNVLVATQTLESFAFEYAKTHLKKNESIIVVEGNYGMSICSVNFTARLCKISLRGIQAGVLLTVKNQCSFWWDNSRSRVDKHLTKPDQWKARGLAEQFLGGLIQKV